MTRNINWRADFNCIHCHAYVTTSSFISGVHNRNHCPYCLWSKHLDLYQAGDRLSACRSGMQPVGLTVKRTWKKYDPVWGGELMIIHRCAECGQISINRIAADDDPDRLLEIYEASLHRNTAWKRQIETQGIVLLGKMDGGIVQLHLFGAHQETYENRFIEMDCCTT
jgi:hypothetical protein